MTAEICGPEHVVVGMAYVSGERSFSRSIEQDAFAVVAAFDVRWEE